MLISTCQHKFHRCDDRLVELGEVLIARPTLMKWSLIDLATKWANAQCLARRSLERWSRGKWGDFGRLVPGASGYLGRCVDRERRIVPVVGASLDDEGLFERLTTVEYQESVLGLDVALLMGGLRIRSEGVLRRVD